VYHETAKPIVSMACLPYAQERTPAAPAAMPAKGQLQKNPRSDRLKPG
jgi:hypothetical protein